MPPIATPADAPPLQEPISTKPCPEPTRGTGQYVLTAPVALLMFNRPRPTARVFEEIRKARPAKLLVVADGPRADRAGEAEKCAETRKIIEGVDWPCEVLTNFAESNMGCRRRVSSGITWVFSQVEEAIILEDDCLPHPTFFRYCAELLEKYRHDERVFHISGDNFRSTGAENRHSYFFSRYNFIWGWASWRRAWKHYDVDMKVWPEVRDGRWLETLFGDRAVADNWAKQFQTIYDGLIDTWDYQWAMAMWANSGLSIRPNVNLISNIGFDADATHTTTSNKNANIPVKAMQFPLSHPEFMMRDGFEDQHLPDGVAIKKLWQRIPGKLKRIARKVIPRKTTNQ